MLLQFNEFLNFIKNKSVAIVGPAEISTSEDISSKIDAHDVVVRINTYHSIIGKKNYGSKVDVVCYSMWTKMGRIPIIDIKNSPVWILNTHKLIYNKVNNKDNFYKSITTYPTINHSIFPEKEYKTFPTSGFCVVDQFLDFLKNNYIKQLSIYGISFNLNSYNKYYNVKTDSSDKTSHHDYEVERNYIKELYKLLTIEEKQRLFIHSEALVEFLNKNEETKPEMKI